MMLELQETGCHNINLVSPSHVVAQIIAAVEVAAGQGLALPLVYNTGGYDSPEALALLDGIVEYTGNHNNLVLLVDPATGAVIGAIAIGIALAKLPR